MAAALGKRGLRSPDEGWGARGPGSKSWSWGSAGGPPCAEAWLAGPGLLGSRL